MFQSDLNELKLLDPTLVPDGSTAVDFTDADETHSEAESATIDDEEILNHCQESHNADVTFDNDDKESSEEGGPQTSSSIHFSHCYKLVKMGNLF